MLRRRRYLLDILLLLARNSPRLKPLLIGSHQNLRRGIERQLRAQGLRVAHFAAHRDALIEEVIETDPRTRACTHKIETA